MMAILGDGALALHEFLVNEPLPLATIQDAVLGFLRDRDDAVLFGAQAVNAYVAEPRMTADVDILSTRPAEFAAELRDHLRERFHIAIRLRQVHGGRGFRLYQVRAPSNRHLVDVRAEPSPPPFQRVQGVAVLPPAHLVASKVRAFSGRRRKPKAGTDWRDLAMLLLTFPELKTEEGPVRQCLEQNDAPPEALAAWRELVAEEIAPQGEDEGF